MSDLDAALEPVRQILAGREADRKQSAAIKARLEEATAQLAKLRAANGNGVAAAAIDWTKFEQNQADLEQVIRKLRSY
jgi:exonuclease VII small subunit